MKLKLLFCSLVIICSDCSREIASVTETDSGSITGWVVDDGKRGISGAVVTLRSTAILNETATGYVPSSTVAKRSLYIHVTADSVRTSRDGYFVFDSVAEGSYYLEVNAHDSSGSIMEISVGTDSSEHSVDSVTAQKFGAIRGSINISLLPSDSVFIYVVELDRMISIDTAGYFSTNKVPSCDYHIQLVEKTVPIPSLLDTIVISVSLQDTAEVYGIGVEAGSLDIQGTVQE